MDKLSVVLQREYFSVGALRVSRALFHGVKPRFLTYNYQESTTRYKVCMS